MMAAVFLMQPLGQLLAYVVGLAVVLTIGRNAGLAMETDHTKAAITVDQIWRYVVGMGAIPALIAIIFRLTIPESPRYTLDVDDDGARALRDTQKYYNIQRRASVDSSGAMHGYRDDVEEHAGIQPVPKATINDDVAEDDDSMVIHDLGGGDSDEEGSDDSELPDPFSWAELKRFFWTEGNIKYLLGTSLTWALLDFAFYGLGINNPQVIAQIWASQPVRTLSEPFYTKRIVSRVMGH
jgi:PHS family inorganic phosphate transporter-like MFS transporter